MKRFTISLFCILWLASGCAGSQYQPTVPASTETEKEAPSSTEISYNPADFEFDAEAFGFPLEDEEAARISGEIVGCSLTGRFTVKGDSISLAKVCSRNFDKPGGSSSFWHADPLVITPIEGRYELPFPGATLTRETNGFLLVATLYGKPITRQLLPDTEGVFSFEDVIDGLYAGMVTTEVTEEQ